MKELTDKEKEIIIQNAKNGVTFDVEKMIAEGTQQLLDEGVPVEIAAQLSAIMIGRMRERRMMANLVHELFPIQQLPTPPPGVFYWPVTEGDDDDE
jgi:hypothetical protein